MPLSGQMVYLFLMSVIPTIPAAFLTFADSPLYESYDHGVRLWGISVTGDQQAAGFIMKLVGGFYLWGWIIVRFHQWNAESNSGNDELNLVVSEATAPGDGGTSLDPDLTFEAVQAEFDRSQPAPTDT